MERWHDGIERWILWASAGCGSSTPPPRENRLSLTRIPCQRIQLSNGSRNTSHRRCASTCFAVFCSARRDTFARTGTAIIPLSARLLRRETCILVASQMLLLDQFL
ncbi:hypothetical protein K461DRAFT_279257 [Myriangium duriaei CBS 260.36]|uniref:Uncharacterized protein n=1 Tax=Myriangium duriaei CBS 260.36 TaxID=1168546 RepID=A0A9P4J3J7_9PEZI|nr:hypothetical protein K461DRAFT_279257 [Myriangium duriaei CBS 260.36]